MSDEDITYGGDAESPGTGWRHRGGVNGMVLAELRELAGSLGVDTTGLRRGDLITVIRERVHGEPVNRRVFLASDPSDDQRWFTQTELAGKDVRIEERVIYTDESAAVTNDAEVQVVVEVEPVDLTGDGEQPLGEGPAGLGPPPPARLLSLASLLLAPGERENWLGELHTARWELRGDPRARRRETWGYFQALGKSLVASWRYRGDGPTQEVS